MDNAYCYADKDGLLDPALVGLKHGCLTIEDRETRRGPPPNIVLYVHVRCGVCDKLSFKIWNLFGEAKHFSCQHCRKYMLDHKLGWLSERCGRHLDKIINPNADGYALKGGAGVEFRFLSPHHAAYWVATNLGVQRDANLRRIDVDGHFEPGNLHWVTRKTKRNPEGSKKSRVAKTKCPVTTH